MYTFIQPQKKIAEEKIEIRLATEVVQALRDYCEFLDSPQGYIVTEVLRKAFRKDRAFGAWRDKRAGASNTSIPAKKARKGNGGKSDIAAA